MAFFQSNPCTWVLVSLSSFCKLSIDGDVWCTFKCSRYTNRSWLAASTAAFAEATAAENLGAKAHRLAESCAALRAAAAAADRRLDGETIGQLQVRLADARAALEAFTASMEGSEAKLTGTATEVADLFKAVSAAARTWTKKARGLTTEPQPR